MSLSSWQSSIFPTSSHHVKKSSWTWLLLYILQNCKTIIETGDIWIIFIHIFHTLAFSRHNALCKGSAWACWVALRFEVCGSRFDWIWFNSISQSQAAGEKHSKTTSDRDPDNLIGDSCIKYGFRLVVQICFQLTLFQVCSRNARCKCVSFRVTRWDWLKFRTRGRGDCM